MIISDRKKQELTRAWFMSGMGIPQTIRLSGGLLRLKILEHMGRYTNAYIKDLTVRFFSPDEMIQGLASLQ